MISVSPTQKLFSITSPLVSFLLLYLTISLWKNKTPLDLLITNELLCNVHLCIFNNANDTGCITVTVCVKCENY